MNSSYSLLFSIELMHEYFLNRKCQGLEIIPTEDCLEAFRKLSIQWRIVENRLMAFIRENENHEPYINSPSGKYYRKDFGKSIFRFYLKVKDPLFFSYTNATFSTRKKFYFSNLAKNKESGFLYLTNPVEEFKNGQEYLPGDLARDAATGMVYEAIRKHSSKKKTELSDSGLWVPKSLGQLATVTEHANGKTYLPGDLVKKPGTENVYEALRKHGSTGKGQLTDSNLWLDRGLGQMHFPTASDLLECSSGNYTFTLAAPVKTADISIFDFNYNPGTPALDVPIGVSESRTLGKPAAELPVNLAYLKPGKYQIKINKETRTVYYDPFLSAGNILGVVELFNFLPASDNYAFLTADEKIKNINYTILFPTRRVLWKYIRKDSKAQTITDTGATGFEFKLAGNDFVSSTPIPLSEGVLKTLKLEFNTADFSLSPLPNPPLNRFSKCFQDDFEYLCSEIYLNY